MANCEVKYNVYFFKSDALRIENFFAKTFFKSTFSSAFGLQKSSGFSSTGAGAGVVVVIAAGGRIGIKVSRFDPIARSKLCI